MFRLFIIGLIFPVFFQVNASDIRDVLEGGAGGAEEVLSMPHEFSASVPSRRPSPDPQQGLDVFPFQVRLFLCDTVDRKNYLASESPGREVGTFPLTSRAQTLSTRGVLVALSSGWKRFSEEVKTAWAHSCVVFYPERDLAITPDESIDISSGGVVLDMRVNLSCPVQRSEATGRRQSGVST